jgi:hypothetical protein
MGTLAGIRRNALRSLIPPPRLQLSEWIEGNVACRKAFGVAPERFTVGRTSL